MTDGTTLGMDTIDSGEPGTFEFDLPDTNILPTECTMTLLKCKNPDELYHCMLNQHLPITVDDAEYIFNEVAKYKCELLNMTLPNDKKVSKLLPDSLETIIGGNDTTKVEKDFDLKKKSSTIKKKAAYLISRPTYLMGYIAGRTAKCIPLVPMVIKSMVLGFKDQLFGISN